MLQALASDPERGTPKLLVFAHDAWPIAVGVGLQIDRAAKKFFVSPEWSNMFGQRFGWTASRQRRLGKAPSVWQIRRGEAGGRSLPLPDGYSLVTEQPVFALDPAETTVRFSKDGNFRQYMSFGWSDSDGDWTASVGHSAVLKFRALPAAGDVEIVLDVFPMSVPGNLDVRRLRLFFSKYLAGDYVVQPQQHEIIANISAAVWNNDAVATLRFEFPDAATPFALGVSEDPRLLAFGFREVRFRLAPPAR